MFNKMKYLFSECEPGPFSLLQKCRLHGQRVRVTVRHCAGVRGVCEGVVIVYDRHLNIVLGRVTEWCTPFRTVGNGGITLSKNKRRKLRKAAAALEHSNAEQTSASTDRAISPELGRENVTEEVKGPLEVGASPELGRDETEDVTAIGSLGGLPGASAPKLAVCDVADRHGSKWEVCRTMNQLFIRGDNVIHVTVVL